MGRKEELRKAISKKMAFESYIYAELPYAKRVAREMRREAAWMKRATGSVALTTRYSVIRSVYHSIADRLARRLGHRDEKITLAAARCAALWWNSQHGVGKGILFGMAMAARAEDCLSRHTP